MSESPISRLREQRLEALLTKQELVDLLACLGEDHFVFTCHTVLPTQGDGGEATQLTLKISVVGLIYEKHLERLTAFFLQRPTSPKASAES